MQERGDVGLVGVVEGAFCVGALGLEEPAGGGGVGDGLGAAAAAEEGSWGGLWVAEKRGAAVWWVHGVLWLVLVWKIAE